jgi:hypothetical protein
MRLSVQSRLAEPVLLDSTTFFGERSLLPLGLFRFIMFVSFVSLPPNHARKRGVSNNDTDGSPTSPAEEFENGVATPSEQKMHSTPRSN